MAGRGPAPKDPATRRRRNAPARGEAIPTVAAAWQHGAIPPVPDGLMPATAEAWNVWFGAWFAAHWSPTDLPGLRQVIRTYDQVERGEFHRLTELRQLMDNYGITPKGQQDRRWAKPELLEPTLNAQGSTPGRRLKVVG